MDYLRPGDTLVVPSLDRLSRSLKDLIEIVAELRLRGVGFASLREALDTTTPGGRLVFHVFAALAEFIRELIVEGTHEGVGAARARGVRLGRPPAMDAEQIRQARALLTRPEESISSIARLLGISRATLYKYLPEAKARPRAIELPADDAETATPVAFPAIPLGTDRTGAEAFAESSDLTSDLDEDVGDLVDDEAAAAETSRDEQSAAGPMPVGALRAVTGLDEGWATDDDDVLWWRGTTRVGGVVKAWPGSGWQARHITDRNVTAGAGPKNRYPSRVKALRALAAESERALRERTPHTDTGVDGLPDAWRLTQTLTEHDEHHWRLMAPDGEIAGTITRLTYGARTEWRADAGDPAQRTRIQMPMTAVTPDTDDPDRGSDFDLWRTRTAAARALAAWHDPNLPH